MPGSAPPESMVIWDDDFLEYDFGPEHPMNPIRIDLTARLVSDLGIFSQTTARVAAAPVLTGSELARVHEAAYIEAVQEVSADPREVRLAFGLGTEDTPVFSGMHAAAARLAGGTLECAKAISTGKAIRAVNFAGGMHHARSDSASGFCVYNDLAVGAAHLLDRGYERILVLDLDGHHGDGTEQIFWDDPRVLTVSVHETGETLFPHTGFANDIGGVAAIGSAANVPLPPGTGDRGWLRAIDAIVPPIAREFRPQVLISQHGADTHRQDPQTHLRITVDGQVQAMRRVRDLADELCEGRWIATGGGGYAIFDVVPRSWALLTGIVTGADLDPAAELPPAWVSYVKEQYGYVPPVMLGDGGSAEWESWNDTGYSPSDPVDRAIMASRRVIFPLFGLDPWFD